MFDQQLFAADQQIRRRDIVPTDGFTQSVGLVITGRTAATLNDNLLFLDFKKHQPNAKVKVAASEPANAPSGILVHKN